MALCSPQFQKFLLNKISCNYGCSKTSKKNIIVKSGEGKRICSAIAIGAPVSVATVSGIRWGSVQLKGAREEMEDDVVIIQSDGISYAAVFDGHAGFSSVKFLREELYKECVAALQGGKLSSRKDFTAIKKALQEAFERTDAKLLKWLEESGEEDESCSTATAILALSRSGKAEVLTDSHRPYGNKKFLLKKLGELERQVVGLSMEGFEETSLYPELLVTYGLRPRRTSKLFCLPKCAEILAAYSSVNLVGLYGRMLKKGVEEGRWSEKFASRIQLTGDFVTACPDVIQVTLGPDAEFILLASDGLWDYMNCSDAINFVRDHLQQHGDVQMASEALAQMALNRRSQDNISIVIADLGRTVGKIYLRSNKTSCLNWAKL